MCQVAYRVIDSKVQGLDTSRLVFGGSHRTGEESRDHACKLQPAPVTLSSGDRAETRNPSPQTCENKKSKTGCAETKVFRPRAFFFLLFFFSSFLRLDPPHRLASWVTGECQCLLAKNLCSAAQSYSSSSVSAPVARQGRKD